MLLITTRVLMKLVMETDDLTVFFMNEIFKIIVELILNRLLLKIVDKWIKYYIRSLHKLDLGPPLFRT